MEEPFHIWCAWWMKANSHIPLSYSLDIKNPASLEILATWAGDILLGCDLMSKGSSLLYAGSCICFLRRHRQYAIVKAQPRRSPSIYISGHLFHDLLGDEKHRNEAEIMHRVFRCACLKRQ